MSDLELLELAAKAAGETGKIIQRPYGGGSVYAMERHDGTFWMPQHDDGDAIRLAVQLNLTFETRPDANGVFVWNNHFRPVDLDVSVWGYVREAGDMQSAARLAIVRAAAEIGRAMS